MGESCAGPHNRFRGVSFRRLFTAVATCRAALRSGTMPDDAKHFRDRAIDCRALAKSARNSCDAAMLEEIAEELDDEARRIEAAEKPLAGSG